MDKIRNSHYFIAFLAIAIVLNIFVNLTTSLLQKHVGMTIHPGPIIYALAWSFGIGLIVGTVAAYMNGALVPATNTEWSEKKTKGLSITFYAFFITTTAFMIINLFGEKKFDETRNAVLLITAFVFIGNLLLPTISLYLNGLGDTHNHEVNEKLAAKKAPVKKGTKKTKLDEPKGTSLIKWVLAIGLIILLLRVTSCNNHTTPPIDPIDYGIKNGTPPTNHEDWIDK